MRRQDTCALCTALNSLAALEDLAASRVKQARKVVNTAISQLVQPVPRILRAPKMCIRDRVITNQPWELEIKKIPSRNKVDGNTVGSELTEKILFRLPMISWMRALLMDIS